MGITAVARNLLFPRNKASLLVKMKYRCFSEDFTRRIYFIQFISKRKDSSKAYLCSYHSICSLCRGFNRKWRNVYVMVCNITQPLTLLLCSIY